jgi:8-oxo-dGTP pyrophosphatase MutT (NUDIX family)
VSSLERLREHPEIARLREKMSMHQPKEADEPGVRRAAVALLLRLGAPLDEPELFFIQRAQYETDPWSGHVAFPGGREEPGDRSLFDTAARETFEETAIDIRRDAELLNHLDDLRPRIVRLPDLVVRPFVVLVGGHSDPILSNEVAASFWVPLSALRAAGGWRDTIVTARGSEYTRRAFHHAGFIVWGMTERIVSGFLSLLEE